MSLMGAKGLLGQREDLVAPWDLEILAHCLLINCSFSVLSCIVS